MICNCGKEMKYQVFRDGEYIVFRVVCECGAVKNTYVE